ncbi:ATP synthase subunit C [Clostridiaceae bacterium HSG29]|nr:ATP synthase subunit C [Clostridiaceae bacterium HSG29]
MKIILAIAIMVVISTILTGVYYDMKKIKGDKLKLKKAFLYNLSIFVPIMLIGILIVVPDIVYAATETGASEVNGLGLLAVAISTGLATIGAGNAVGSVGSSALGAISEDPDILGKTLIYVGLAEGIAIYGLIISILILGRL